MPVLPILCVYVNLIYMYVVLQAKSISYNFWILDHIFTLRSQTETYCRYILQ